VESVTHRTDGLVIAMSLSAPDPLPYDLGEKSGPTRGIVMRRFVLSLGIVSTLTIANAAADPGSSTSNTATQATPQASAPVAASDPDRMVCRTLEAKTGSRIGGRRECRTQREWDDIRQQNQRELEKMQARDAMAPR
jgi:hypothetical protein